MKKLLVVVLLFSFFTIDATTSSSSRLTKKDKQDLVEMFTEFIDGMERNTEMPVKDQIQTRWWFFENPMTRIERSIDQLNQVAQQIQNYILDVHHGGSKECCKETLARLEQLEMFLAKLIVILIEERKVIGSLDDQSVGEQEFNSVADIDNAEYTIITWLKTIYREQLKDKFIS